MRVAIYRENTSHQTKVAEVHKYRDGSYHLNLITVSRAAELPEEYSTFEEAEAAVLGLFKVMGATRIY